MLIFFPFPGIQVRLGLKSLISFRHKVKIGDPFTMFAGRSRHFFLWPWKYFFEIDFFLQVDFPETRFQRSLALRAIF
jgi:hypothetical protein